LKTNEEFRASVYARAEREKQRLAARRQKTRNACLSAAMLLAVAAIAVPMARSMRGNSEQLSQAVLHQEALVTRMVLLVGTQAVMLENEAQQKEFVSKYKAAMNLGDGEGAPFPAADTPRPIRSTDELAAFLAELPEGAEAMKVEYNEAFFEGNDLYAMPMELAAQPESAARETTTTVPETASTQVPAVTAAIVPDATIPDAVLPSNEDIMPAEPETAPDEWTSAALTSFPESGLLQGSDVRVLLLVPVNKG